MSGLLVRRSGSIMDCSQVTEQLLRWGHSLSGVLNERPTTVHSRIYHSQIAFEVDPVLLGENMRSGANPRMLFPVKEG